MVSYLGTHDDDDDDGGVHGERPKVRTGSYALLLLLFSVVHEIKVDHQATTTEKKRD